MSPHGSNWRPAPTEREYLAHLDERMEHRRTAARAELSPWVRRALAGSLPASDRTGCYRRTDAGR